MEGKNIIRIESELEVKPEEIKLVQLIADGLRSKQVAEKLGVPKRTAEGRMFMLRKKYKVATPVGLVMLFYRNGLIS